LSATYQTAREEDQDHLWTRAGLAAYFGVSEWTIKHYIAACPGVPPALGRHPNGFNYNHSHFQAIAKKRAELESRVPMTRHRKHRPHIVIRVSRETAGVS
jgi:hypothetical protein